MVMAAQGTRPMAINQLACSTINRLLGKQEGEQRVNKTSALTGEMQPLQPAWLPDLPPPVQQPRGECTLEGG